MPSPLRILSNKSVLGLLRDETQTAWPLKQCQILLSMCLNFDKLLFKNSRLVPLSEAVAIFEPQRLSSTWAICPW